MILYRPVGVTLVGIIGVIEAFTGPRFIGTLDRSSLLPSNL